MTDSRLAVDRRFHLEGSKAVVLVGYILLAVNFAANANAQVLVLEPTSSFTARHIGGHSVLVADSTPSAEGAVWKTRILEIKEDVSDRAVLEFDLRGRSQEELVTLDFYLFNLDAPSFTDIFLYSFKGNGLANAADYFRTDNLVTSFTDNGLADGQFVEDLKMSSFDVTTVFNNAVANGDDYLGFLFRNSISGPMYARYRLGNGSPDWLLPRLVIGVPEPATIVTLWIGVGTLNMCRRRQRR